MVIASSLAGAGLADAALPAVPATSAMASESRRLAGKMVRLVFMVILRWFDWLNERRNELGLSR